MLLHMQNAHNDEQTTNETSSLSRICLRHPDRKLASESRKIVLPVGLGDTLKLVLFLLSSFGMINILMKLTGNDRQLTLMAYEFEEPFAALMSSSARHSAIDFTLRKADSRVYISRSLS